MTLQSADVSPSNDWFLTRVCIAGALSTLAIAGLYACLHSPYDVYASLASSTVCIAAFLVWRVSGRQRMMLHVAIGALTATYATLIALGCASYIASLGLLTILGFMLLGRRAGLLWTIAILAVVVALMVFTANAGLAQVHEDGLVVRMLRVVLLVPTLAAIGYFFEQQRQQNIASLQTAVSARSRLLANVSHEMRTPLNGILGLAQALRLEALPAKTIETLDIIHQSGETLLALISGLLDVARAEAGKVDFTIARVNLTQLIAQTVALHGAAATGISVEAPREDIWVKGDSVRIRQVLGNLVANAVRHGRGSPVCVRLRATADAELLHVAIDVSDGGPGLDQAQCARLFQAFVQLDPETATCGSGLGLYISRTLARALSGDLVVASTPGVGSTFTFTLTLPHAAAPTSCARPQDEAFASSVLVVDDNDINRRVAQALLTKLGCTVETLDGGEKALTRTRDKTFDLILMDLQMPEIDGFETTRRLRAAGYAAPIFALTASAQSETPGQCSEAGMNGCLVKPLRIEQLTRVLARPPAQ